MLKWLLSCGLAVCSVSTAHAEIIDTPEGILRAVRTGRSGAWLDDEALKKCLLATTTSENLALQVANLKEQKSSLESQIQTIIPMLGTANAQTTLWKRSADAYKETSEELSSELRAWYRNPAIVAPVGFALGIAAAAVVALKQ